MTDAKFKAGDELVLRVDLEGRNKREFEANYPNGSLIVHMVEHSGGQIYYRSYSPDNRDGSRHYVQEEYLQLRVTELKKLRGKRVKKIKIDNAGSIVGQEEAKEALRIAVEEDIPTLLVGETGTGKTSIIEELAKENGKNFVRIPITGETTPDDIVGKTALKSGATKFEYAQIPIGLENGDYMVIDEINMALPEVLALLQPLFDGSRELIVTQNNGESIKGKNGARVFCTMNPVDEYAGTKELNKAFASRFGMTIEMKYPEPDVEIQIVAQKCEIDEEKARKIVDFGQMARKAKALDEIFYTCSTRDLIQWGNLTRHLSMQRSFELTVLNKAPQDKAKLKEFYSTIMNSYKELTESGFEPSIDYFNKEKYAINNAKKALDAEREVWKQEIKATTEKIREEVVKGLVKSSKTAKA